MKQRLLLSIGLLLGMFSLAQGQCLPPTNVHLAQSPQPFVVAWDGPIDTFYVFSGPVGFSQTTGVQTVIDTTVSFWLWTCQSIDVYVARKCGTDTSALVGPITITAPIQNLSYLQHALHERMCGDSIYSYTQKGFQFGNHLTNSPSGGAASLIPLARNGYSISDRKYMYADGSGSADSTLTYFTPWVSNLAVDAAVFFFYSNNTTIPGDNVTLKVHIDNGLNVFKNVFQYSGDSPNWKRKIIDLTPFLSTQSGKIRVAFQLDQTTAILPEYNDFVLDEVFIGDTAFCTNYTPKPKNNIQRTGNSIAVARTITRPIVHVQWGPIGFSPGNGQFGDTTVYNTNTVTINNVPLGTEWMYIKDTCQAMSPMYWNSAPWTGPFDVDSTNIDFFFGKVYLETDDDCVIDSGETALGSEYFYIENKTTNQYLYPNYQGNFHGPASSIANLLEFKEKLNLGLTFPSACSSNALNFYPDSLAGAVQNFARKPGNYKDIRVVSPWRETFVQGAPTSWGTIVLNTCATTFNNLDLFVTIDTSKFDVGSLKGFSAISANSNTYAKTIPPLGPFTYTWTEMPSVIAKIGAQFLGNSTFLIEIDTVPNEASITNNTFVKIAVNGAAIDPNDKQVWPIGNTTDTAITQLNYRIRFQNTGTLAADLVRVVDTLPFFKPQNFFMWGASHDYYLFVDSNNVATFTFYNIQLPDSASDPEGSKGFIDYSIMLDQPMAVGDSVANRAHIFFDYQPAIITNWAWTKIVQPATFGGVEAEGLKFNMYPNPASTALRIELTETDKYNITLTDLAGRVLLTKNLEGQEAELDVHNLPNGVYVIGIHSEAKNVSGYQRLSVMH